MRSISRIASTTGGFAVILTVLIGLTLLVVGFGSDTLPFPLHSDYSDAAVSHWPNALYLQQSIQSGALPLWRNLLMSGQPFAANPLNKVWYPPQWLALLLPAALHLNVLIWLHLVLAGLGMRALGLRLGVRVGAAGVMGLAYGLAPRLWVVTGAGHLDIVYASAWIPWLLWAVHNAVNGDAAIEWHIALLGGICALSFLADIRTSVFSFGAGAAYAVWLLSPHPQPFSLREKGAKQESEVPLPQGEGFRVRVFVILASAVLAVGLTAIQWLPLTQLLPSVSRNGLTPADAAVYSLHPAQIIGLIVPERFGFQETLTYAGIAVLILTLIAVLRAPRRHLFWLGLIVLTVLYALGDQGPLWPLLVRVLPPLLWLRVPARAWIVVVVALIVLAGFGIETLSDPRTQRQTLPIVGIVLLALGIGWGVIASRLTLPQGARIVPVLGFIVMGGLFLAIRRIPKAALIPALAVLIAVDLLWMNVSLVHGVPRSTWLDAYAPIAQALKDAGVTRLYSPDYSFPQQAAANWNIPEFGGVDPFQSAAYVTAFERATGTHATVYTVTLPPYDTDDPQKANRSAVIDPQQLADWDVSRVLTGFPLNVPALTLVQQIDNLYLYKNTLLPDIQITWNSPNRFTAANHSDLTVNVAAWMPGWNTDSHNDAAVIVQPGQTLTASYDAPGLGLGFAITLLSTLIIVIVVVANSLLVRRD